MSVVGHYFEDGRVGVKRVTDHAGRPKETGRQERRVCLVRVVSREGVPLRSARLLVPNEPVHREIRHTDLQLLRALYQDFGNVDTEGRLPKNAKRGSIHCYLSQVFYVSQVEPKLCPRGKPGRGCVNGFGIGSMAGEVFDASILTVAP